jgi:hypothetical protein
LTTTATSVLRAFNRVRAKLPSHAADRAARLGALRQLVGWLAPTAAAVAALAADDLVRHADGAMYRDEQRQATAHPGEAAREEAARGAN